MPTAWPQDALGHIRHARELRITPERADGGPRREVPIWAVTVDRQVYVRTWHRRHTGWFGHALTTRSAQIRVPSLDAAVTIEDVGSEPSRLRADIDAAYRAKYGPHGTSVDQMVTDSAAASTLRLIPRSPEM